MKKIYKVLISMLIISMLTITAISAVTGPYTGCVSTSATKYDVKGIFYYFQPGSIPISTCKTGDYQITIYEKTYIDNALNTLQTQINSLANRMTNLENNQSQTFIFGNSFYKTIIPNGTWQYVANYTFNLPIDSYVYVEASGSLSSGNTIWAVLPMGIDDYPKLYEGGGVSSDNLRGRNVISSFDGFQMSKVYYLSKGEHTLHLAAIGYELNPVDPNEYPLYIMFGNFNIITSQNKYSGRIMARQEKQNGKIINAVITKDGKIATNK